MPQNTHADAYTTHSVVHVCEIVEIFAQVRSRRARKLLLTQFVFVKFFVCFVFAIQRMTESFHFETSRPWSVRKRKRTRSFCHLFDVLFLIWRFFSI
jgi:hypothetical protein